MEEPKLSCDGFPSDTTSSNSGIDFSCKDQSKHVPKKENLPEPESKPSCSNILSSSATSTSSSVSSAYFRDDCKEHRTTRKAPPNIGYELAVAKSVLQQYSTLSGDNLFDHLADIIRRVIDERPPNIIDFFEEFSRNVREQKFHQPERFPIDAIFEETRYYKISKKILLSMKLPIDEDQLDHVASEMSAESVLVKNQLGETLTLDINDLQAMFITFNERVQQLQFYWNQCGFSISTDDIFQLAMAMNRLQTHPSIMQCRFWGVVNGLKASYYVVEATLTREEVAARVELMEAEMRKMQAPRMPIKREERPLPSHVGPELTPGVYGWENYPEEELAKMHPPPDHIPVVEEIETYDIPPELVGRGANRYSYFVVNALSDEWSELPIVTPKQIVVSRHIKKFLTGDLEAPLTTYPCFTGKEKHYLRAQIARITASTYIAPCGYFRKMTKKERRLWEGIEDDEMEEEEEEEPEVNEGEEEEEEEVDNDIVLLRNEKYEPNPLETMMAINRWQHVRPNLLEQGRVVWYDEEKARKEREKELARLLRLQMLEEMGEEEEEEQEAGDDVEEGEEEELLEDLNLQEYGPSLMTPCNVDTSEEFTVPWVARLSSLHTNKNERVLVMRSNIWPGAFTFTFENICESVYMGWGHKHVSRNMQFKHLPAVLNEHPHTLDDYIEATDPSFAEEEAYRAMLLRRQMHPDDILGQEELDEFEEEPPYEYNEDR